LEARPIPERPIGTGEAQPRGAFCAANECGVSIGFKAADEAREAPESEPP